MDIGAIQPYSVFFAEADVGSFLQMGGFHNFQIAFGG
jgi:hypothetical protein